MKKNNKYARSFQIFPDNDRNSLDWWITEYTRQLILTFVQSCARPTFLAIAEAWGIDRVRLSRIVEALGIKEEIKKIKKERNK